MTSKFILVAALAAGVVLPAFAADKPTQPYGVQSGDVTRHSAIVWGRSDVPARMIVEWSTSLDDITVASDPVEGVLYTAPTEAQDIRFVWSGDTAGQGWGINKDWGGKKIYAEMARVEPQFFIHNGDTIHADGPIKPEVELADGSKWVNVTIPEKK